MKSKYIVIIALSVYALVIILPPIIHGYVYPTQGDDSVYHLVYLDSIIEGNQPISSYIGRTITGYPMAWVHKITGISIDAIFLWFNYLILILIGLANYILIWKLTDWKCGLLAIPLVVFTTTAILFPFKAGVIYSLITIGILFPLCLLGLTKALSKKSIKYTVLMIVTCCASFCFHSISIFTTHDTYIDPFTKLAIPTVRESVPTFPEFTVQILGLISIFCMAIAIYTLVRKRAVLSLENKIFLSITGGISIVLAIVIFTGYTSYSMRLAWYLAIVIAVMVAYLVGMAVKVNNKIYLLVSVLIVASSIPQIINYFDNNTAIKEADKQAIEYVNSIEGEYYSVSPEIAYWIYSRYIVGKEYKYGEYPYIQRNEMMTYKTNPLTPYYWFREKELIPEGSVETFKQGDIEINVYIR